MRQSIPLRVFQGPAASERERDTSRPVMLVEGVAPDVEMASFALIEARGGGRMAFGGFFPGGETLAVMRGDDASKALDELRATGFWEEASLRARPLLYVL